MLRVLKEQGTGNRDNQLPPPSSSSPPLPPLPPPPPGKFENDNLFCLLFLLNVIFTLFGKICNLGNALI